MKLTFDFEKQTIAVSSNVNLGELMERLEQMMGFKWKKFSLIHYKEPYSTPENITLGSHTINLDHSIIGTNTGGYVQDPLNLGNAGDTYSWIDTQGSIPDINADTGSITWRQADGNLTSSTETCCHLSIN